NAAKTSTADETTCNENGTKGAYVIVLQPNLNHAKMTPSVLKVRKNEFENKLMDFAKKEHNKYLLSLNPPIEIAPELLRKWHPMFRFPEIPEANLPELPSDSKAINQNQQQLSSVSEF